MEEIYLTKLNKAKENGEYFSEDDILNYFTQIWLAIKHIHDRKIIHRDLKAQNIFLEKNGTIKLGDFGIAKVLDQTAAQAATQVGTPYYISPEIIKGKQYSFETDIWSLGVLLYEMWALDVPIKAKNLHELYMKISNWKRVPSIPSRYSQALQDLVDEILVADPKKRPTINQILKSDLLKERVKNYLNRIDFEEEFSHTILHNQYLFDKRKNRVAKHNPISNSPAILPVPSPIPIPVPASIPLQQPKEPDWIKQSPRAAMGGGFKMNKNSSIKKKDSESRVGARPASAKYAKPKPYK